MRRIWGPREKSILCWLVAAFICCSLFCVLLLQIQGYMQLMNDLKTAQGKLAQTRSLSAAEASEEVKLKDANSKLSELEKLFQMEMRDGSAWILLGQLSTAWGVEITGITPEKIKENQQTLEIPLVVTVKGDYLDVLGFCQEIENHALVNLSVIKSLKIRADKPSQGADHDPGISAEPGMVQAKLWIAIYSAKIPQEKYCFEWGKGRTNIFYPSPDASPEANPQPEFEDDHGSE